jgi:hypothetical protein
VFGTALAFAVAGIVCVLFGVPPERTSLAADPCLSLLQQYIAFVESSASSQQQQQQQGGAVAAAPAPA